MLSDKDSDGVTVSSMRSILLYLSDQHELFRSDLHRHTVSFFFNEVWHRLGGWWKVGQKEMVDKGVLFKLPVVLRRQVRPGAGQAWFVRVLDGIRPEERPFFHVENSFQ